MKHLIEQLDKKYPNLVKNLSEAIYSMDLNNYRNKSKRRVLGDSPWEFIPNVKSFNVTVNVADPLFKIFNIDKKLKPELTLKEYQNQAINRYIEHQVIRLKKLRDTKPKIYWWTAFTILKRSNSFRVLGINHVFKNWHRNYPLNFIIGVNRMCSTIINKLHLTVHTNRVYIPKGEKGYRPLGVPKPEWRLYLHMLQQFITFFVQNKLDEGQHGFMPKRGTLTAWKSFFEQKIHEKKWIYEYDFTSYFDSVSLQRIMEQLHRWECPDWMIIQLYLLNRNTPILPKERKLDEERLILKASDDAKQRILKYYYLTSHFFRWFSDQFPDWMTDEMWEYRQMYFEEGLGETEYKLTALERGVSQGTATGPILANILMDNWVKPIWHKSGYIKTLAYADDSISYCDEEFIRYPEEDSGIEINEKKSGWVKKDGIWIKPLKFLGMTFDGKTFKGETRKGSNLTFPPELELLTLLENERNYDNLTPEEFLEKINNNEIEEYQNEYENKKSWTKYFKSKIIGFAFSRIYIGKWNLGNLQQDFSLKFVPKSWMDSKYNCEILPLKLEWDELDVFNSTSIACRSLLEIFREKQKFTKSRKHATLTVRYIPSNLQKEETKVDINRHTKYGTNSMKRKQTLEEKLHWRLFYQNKPEQPLYPSYVKKLETGLFFTAYRWPEEFPARIYFTLAFIINLLLYYESPDLDVDMSKLAEKWTVDNGATSLIPGILTWLFVVAIMFLLGILCSTPEIINDPKLLEFILQPDIDNDLWNDRTTDLLSKSRLEASNDLPNPGTFTGKSPQMMSGHFERWDSNLPDFLN
jgi:hypothetical protein